MTKALHLLAQGPDDLPALSALLQDATLRVVDVGFDRRHHRLALLVNRYRHEAGAPSRIRSALRLEGVLAVQRQGWPADGHAVLGLLSLAQDGKWLVLTCSGGTALRAQVEAVDVVLEDIGEAWATARVPRHEA